MNDLQEMLQTARLLRITLAEKYDGINAIRSKSRAQEQEELETSIQLINIDYALYQIKSAITHMLFLNAISQNKAEKKESILQIANAYVGLYRRAIELDQLVDFFTEGHRKVAFKETSFACRYHDTQEWADEKGYFIPKSSAQRLVYDQFSDDTIVYNSIRDIQNDIETFFPSGQKLFSGLTLSTNSGTYQFNASLYENTRFFAQSEELTREILLGMLDGMRQEALNSRWKATPNMQDRVFSPAIKDGIPLLHYALTQKDEDLIKSVITDYSYQTDNLNFCDASNNNNTALHLLVMNHYPITEIRDFYNLLNNPNNLLVQNKAGQTFLHLLISEADHFTSADVVVILKQIFDPLLEKQQTDIIKKWLLLSLQNHDNALLLAIRHCSEELTHYLLSLLPRVISSADELKAIFSATKANSSPQQLAINPGTPSVLMPLLYAGAIQAADKDTLNLFSPLYPLILSPTMPQGWDIAKTLQQLYYTGYPQNYWHKIYSSWFANAALAEDLTSFFHKKKIQQLLKILSTGESWEFVPQQQNEELQRRIAQLSTWRTYLGTVAESTKIVTHLNWTLDNKVKFGLIIGSIISLLVIAGFGVYAAFYDGNNMGGLITFTFFAALGTLFCLVGSLTLCMLPCESEAQQAHLIQQITEIQPLSPEFHSLETAIIALLKKCKAYGMPVSELAATENWDTFVWTKESCQNLLDETLALLRHYQTEQVYLEEVLDISAIEIPNMPAPESADADVSPSVVSRLWERCAGRRNRVAAEDLEAAYGHDDEREPLLRGQRQRVIN